MARNWIESIVGAAVIAVAAWFLVYSYQTSARGTGSDGYELRARFTGVDGVTVGSDVRISGIKVGQVRSMRLDPESYLAEVHMAIAASTEVPADSTVAVKSESLMGGRYLAISPGADDLMLENGDVIQYTQPAMVLEDLIGQMIFSDDKSN